MGLLLLRIMTWSGLLNETLDTCTLRASKNIDDQTNRNNELDLISSLSPCTSVSGIGFNTAENKTKFPQLAS